MQVGVGERTLVGHLARHLQPEVDAWGEEWDVDTEYNRMSGDHDEVTYKYLLDVLGDSRRPAYPDLIVHQRGVDGWDGGNLLVVEAKRSPTHRDRLEDHAKVVAWMRELQYQHGLRLELWPAAAGVSWVSALDDPRVIVPAQALD
ncbi:MAG TPA: hypothetical protein VFQ85_09375 [Mycobacteriales bacterium]|jgi:hypothetical protein|nr:hypothetical protein [Mycobacteriales bacterium]